MAEPISASTLVKILKAEGVTVEEVGNWRTHNRNTKGAWGPINGVMIHHTVTSGTGGSVQLCYDGRSDLPGPLCHGVIDKDGRVHLVGNGRANHAGLGDSDVLRAVVSESALPHDNQADTDGNRHFYGFECINLGDGKDPWPEAQKDAIARVSAAICRHYGWSERSVIGHKEWQPGKIDPRGFTMDGMRGRIATLLAGKAGAGKTDSGKPDGGKDSGNASGKGSGTPHKPPYAPFPGAGFFRAGQKSAVITAMGRRLVAEGCGHYKEGPGPEWTDADRASYAAWQGKLHFKGKDADGIPGKVSWDKLKVPSDG